MAKASTPGLTKTRLVPPLRFEEAAAFNTAFLQDAVANLLSAGRQVEITGYIAFGPPGSESFFERMLGPEIDLISAWLPNFGDCLLLAIETILARGQSAAVVLNSDSPTLPASLLVGTCQDLGRLDQQGRRQRRTVGVQHHSGALAARQDRFDRQ